MDCGPVITDVMLNQLAIYPHWKLMCNLVTLMNENLPPGLTTMTPVSHS